MIKQGAKLVQDWNDVVVELRPDDRRRLIDAGRRRILAAAGEPVAETFEPEQASLGLGPASETARKILGLLLVEQAHTVDELLVKLEHCSSSEVIAALFELEMLGLVRQMPGKKFVKVW